MAGWFDENAPAINPSAATPSTDARTLGSATFMDPAPAPAEGMPAGGGGFYTPGPNDATTGMGINERVPSGVVGPGYGGGPVASGNPTDRNYVIQQIQAKARQMQQAGQYVNPSVFNDPGYWADRMIEKGGWVNNGPGGDNIGYFTSRFATPEGAPAGGSGGAGGFGGMTGSGTLGGILTPYSGTFEMPDLNDQTDPGYNARMKMGLDALQRSAFAKGTGLTGGTLKDIVQYGQDYASNEYDKVFNRGLNRFGVNYGIFKDNQDRPFSKLYDVTQLGLNAAGAGTNYSSSYGNQVGNTAGAAANLATNYGSRAADLTTGIGNVNAAGQARSGSAWSSVPGAMSNLANTIYASRRPRVPSGISPYNYAASSGDFFQPHDGATT